MNTLQMQQLISTTVPEFSGEDNNRRYNNLTRFIATTDNIYNSLTTQEDRNIFNRSIKLKLTDAAFDRVHNRNIHTYPEIKKLLTEMYVETQSLEQLENKYRNIQQTFNESTRNYGFRLLEALDKYKDAYKEKFNIRNIDQSYEQCLQINTIKTFKRGLNSTILRNRIATSTATDLENLILETERVEKDLQDTDSSQYDNIDIKQNSTTFQINHYPTQTPTIICNYCNTPNHSYDKCRTRIYNERNNPRRFNPQRNWNNQQPISNRPHKYCSYCKTTTGHTFEECKSKFKQNTLQPNYNYQPPRNKYNNNHYNNNNNYPNDNYSNNHNKNQNQRTNNYQRPWNNYSQYQPQNNNYQNQQNYSQHQPENNNYQNQQNYSRNNNTQQPNNKNINQPPTTQTFRPQNSQTSNETNTQNPDNELNNMMRNMTINTIENRQQTQSYYNNQGNFSGSNQD